MDSVRIIRSERTSAVAEVVSLDLHRRRLDRAVEEQRRRAESMLAAASAEYRKLEAMEVESRR
jgi:hypothetical protein